MKKNNRLGAIFDKTDIIILEKCIKPKKTVGLSKELNVAHKNILKHIKKLESFNLIKRKKIGRFIYNKVIDIELEFVNTLIRKFK